METRIKTVTAAKRLTAHVFGGEDTENKYISFDFNRDMSAVKNINNHKSRQILTTFDSRRRFHSLTGFPLFWMKKIPGDFQSNFSIFQVLSVIVRNRRSNTSGPQQIPNSYQT